MVNSGIRINLLNLYSSAQLYKLSAYINVSADLDSKPNGSECIRMYNKGVATEPYMWLISWLHV